MRNFDFYVEGREMRKSSLFLFLTLSILLINQPSHAKLAINQELGTLIYAMPYDFTEYSVYTANSYANAQWQSSIMNGLYKRSAIADRDWIVDLAASLPDVSEDLRSFNVTLKEGLTFSNGEPLTADDVIFSFQVAMTPLVNTNFYSVYIDFLTNDSIIKISDLEVSITLEQQFAFPFGILSTPIIPQETFQADYDSCVAGVTADCTWNSPDGSDVIGAGPYKFSAYDGTNQIVTVVRNDNYYGWDEPAPLGASGNIGTIVFKKTTEKAAAIAELSQGHIDIMDAQYIAGVDELTGFPGVTEVFVGDPAHQEISLNHLHPHWGTGEDIPGNGGTTAAHNLADALLVRKAMSHIVDREFAANEISEGLAQPAATTMPSAALGWDPTIIPREYDIQLAKGLMEEAGYDYDTLTDSDNDGVYETFFLRAYNDVAKHRSCKERMECYVGA